MTDFPSVLFSEQEVLFIVGTHQLPGCCPFIRAMPISDLIKGMSQNKLPRLLRF